MISIIIPIYNKEKYLHRCIDSILSQSYTDFEALLVDDGSKDSSSAICDEYTSKDKRIIVFHNENGGVSAARNCGLDNAHGKWVCFVDADDYVDKDYLQNFISCIKPETEMVLQSFWYHNGWHNTINNIILPTMHMDGNYNLVQWLEDAKGVHNGFIWHRLFRMDIVKRENARFPLGISIAEDGWFYLGYLRNANNFEFTSKQGYHYFAANSDGLTANASKSLDVNEALIRNFTSLMYNFVVPAERKVQHLHFVRRYMWRFIIDRLIAPSFTSKARKQQSLDLAYTLINDYDFYQVGKVRPSVRLIINALKIKNIVLRDSILNILVRYRKLETKTKRFL